MRGMYGTSIEPPRRPSKKKAAVAGIGLFLGTFILNLVMLGVAVAVVIIVVKALV